MLQYCKCYLVEFINQVNSSIYVKEIIVRYLFTMNLIEHLVQITVEETFLMRILTIAKLLLIFKRATESRAFITIKMVEDC